MKKLIVLMLLPFMVFANDQGEVTTYTVYDGDTLTGATIDIGWNVSLTNQRIRIFGIDTPELRTKDPEEKKSAQMSTQALKDLLLSSSKVTVTLVKRDSFGRLLCHVAVETSKGTIDVAEYMLSTGMAKVYKK